MDDVKLPLGNRGMTMEAGRKIGKSGESWYICTGPDILLGRVFFRTLFWWLSSGEGGMPLFDAVGIQHEKGGVKYMG